MEEIYTEKARGFQTPFLLVQRIMPRYIAFGAHFGSSCNTHTALIVHSNLIRRYAIFLLNLTLHCTVISKTIIRPSVRAGGTGGNPPVNFEQRVASTRPEIRRLILIVKFGVVLYQTSPNSLNFYEIKNK